MDPRVFFKQNPSPTSPTHSPLSASASSTDDPADLSQCRYSSFYSTQCVNNHCDTVKKQFRQCDNRPAEELITDDDGTQHWQPTNEAASRLTAGALTADVTWPDPVTGLFDELRAQTRLIGDAFRQWEDEGEGRRGEGGDEQSRAGSGEGDGGDGLVGGVVDLLHGMSRDFVDALFDRSPATPPTSRRSDKDGTGDVDDDEL